MNHMLLNDSANIGKMKCSVPGCGNPPIIGGLQCTQHTYPESNPEVELTRVLNVRSMTGAMAADNTSRPVEDQGRRGGDTPMSTRYPKYYRPIPKGVTEIDTYAINMMFPINDPSGALIHARKKLLIPGTRTGGKSLVDDVREARDTLTRWLQLQNQ